MPGSFPGLSRWRKRPGRSMVKYMLIAPMKSLHYPTTQPLSLIGFGPLRRRALAEVRGSAPCSLTSGRPAGLAGGDDLLNSSSRGSGPAALPTHHNRELNPARPLCDPAWRRRFHTQIRPSWRTQAARPVEAARRAGVPQAHSGPHCCGRCAHRSHDHRLSHPRSRASSHCRCWRPGPPAQRGGAGASLALRGA